MLRSAGFGVRVRLALAEMIRCVILSLWFLCLITCVADAWCLKEPDHPERMHVRVCECSAVSLAVWKGHKNGAGRVQAKHLEADTRLRAQSWLKINEVSATTLKAPEQTTCNY